MILGLVAAVCAFSVLVAPALATPPESTAPLFTASKSNGKGPLPFPLKLKGVGVGPQEFTFKSLKISCLTAKIGGEITGSPSQTVKLIVTYKDCSGGPISFGNVKKQTIPIHFKEKGEYTYHFNGFVENEESIEMKTKYLGCLVEADSGTIPEKAEEFPGRQYDNALYSAKEGKLEITNAFAKTEWEEEGGGFCEEPGIELSEGEAGKQLGHFLVEIPKGTIGLEEA
jgi:hypothetical protein